MIAPRRPAFPWLRDLLDRLATLTRDDLRLAGTGAVVPTLSQPTATQRRPFELLCAEVPLRMATVRADLPPESMARSLAPSFRLP